MTAGNAEALASADTASTFGRWGGWGANLNASNVEAAPELVSTTTILWHMESRMSLGL